MADIKRYYVGGDWGYGYCDEDPKGEYVTYEDHKKIVDSTVEELTAQASEIYRLKKENARLQGLLITETKW